MHVYVYLVGQTDDERKLRIDNPKTMNFVMEELDPHGDDWETTDLKIWKMLELFA